MIRHLESGEPVDLLTHLFSESRQKPDGPWVMLNMVASADGATALQGGATALNDPDDVELFLSLRAVADVVLVGAETVRSENLGPVKLNDQMREHRSSNGIEGSPRLAILSRSLRLDPDHRVFSDQTKRPLIITPPREGDAQTEAISEVADLVFQDPLDGAGIVAALRPANVILCEGGPTVNSQLIEAGLVDELNLTVSPMFALGESQRVGHGPELDPPTELRFERLFLGDRSLFLRFVKG